MSVSVGISIGAREVRAVVLRNGRVAAATEAELAPGDTLADAVAEVLAGAPVPRFPRPAVVAALGPSRAQVRRVTGLPPVKDPRVLAEILREGTSRFFLQNGAALVTHLLAGRTSRLQTGYVYHYAFAMLIGVLGLVTWVVAGVR